MEVLAMMATEKQIDLHIRWMLRGDEREVLAIERNSFEFPWTVEQFVRTMLQRNCIGMVALHEGDVVAYMVYELHKQGIRLLNLAVHRDSRNLGVGRQMMEKLIGKLSPQRRKIIACEVREKNLDAQLFFKSMGFRAMAVLRDFYDDSPEDAYRFAYSVKPWKSDKPGKVRMGDCEE